MSAEGARRWPAVAMLGALTTVACSPLLLPEDPSDDPAAVTSALWTEVDEYYPWFELKAVDWDAVRDTMLDDPGAGLDDRELFDRLAAALEVLRDGHVALIAPFERRSWTGWYEGRPGNFDPGVARSYLTARTGAAAGGSVTWGLLEDRIGYVHIAAFAGPGIGEAVSQALEVMEPLEGLVVDIRGNGGGSDTNAEAAAGRFADRRRLYRTVRYKSGPDHEDFGPVIEGFVEPVGTTRYVGPTVVLQNRRVFSAAEDFLLAMGEMPHVTAVGDTSGGGGGNPIGRELPNGWVVNVPRWRSWTASGEVYEGVGLAPDETVAAPESDLALGRDAILERAVRILGGG